MSIAVWRLLQMYCYVLAFFFFFFFFVFFFLFLLLLLFLFFTFVIPFGDLRILSSLLGPYVGYY